MNLLIELIIEEEKFLPPELSGSTVQNTPRKDGPRASTAFIAFAGRSATHAAQNQQHQSCVF